jgi:hypothetical protein
MRTRLVRLSVALLAPLIVSACDPSATSVPTMAAPQPSAVPTASTTLFSLSGIVTDEDERPVPGLTVHVLPHMGRAPGTRVSTQTNSGGAYAIDFSAVLGQPGGFVGELDTEGVGYEPSHASLLSGGNMNVVKDLHVYAIRRIQAGESIHVVIAPSDPYCGGINGDDWVCRTVRVTSPGRGTITIDVVSESGAPPGSGLEITSPSYSCCGLHQTVAVSPGAEVVAQLGMPHAATAGAGYTMTTSFAP